MTINDYGTCNKIGSFIGGNSGSVLPTTAGPNIRRNPAIAYCALWITSYALGWYWPSTSGGRTTDPNGRVIAQGNVLASLIADLL
jgi:hypothetical protein